MINDRIAFLISALHLNPNSFAEKIGVSTTVIYNIIKGRRTKPSYDLLMKILAVYKQIDVEWLLRGQGVHWFKPEEQKVQPKVLAKRIEELLVLIEEEPTSELEVAELVELSKVMLDDYHNSRVALERLQDQNQQIFSMLREQLGLKI
jgi:transcriptional regulator with XRE-family HTH domain